jgi:hypothetical protein
MQGVSWGYAEAAAGDKSLIFYAEPPFSIVLRG